MTSRKNTLAWVSSSTIISAMSVPTGRSVEKNRSRGNLLAKLILYADDILVVARSKEELEGMMQIITKHFTEFGLRVAESKTVTMTWRTMHARHSGSYYTYKLERQRSRKCPFIPLPGALAHR